LLSAEIEKHVLMKRGSYIFFLLSLFVLLSLFGVSQTSRVKQLLHYHWGLASAAEIHKLRFAGTPKGKEVFFEGDGVRIAGTIFSVSKKNAPGIIFLHGSSVQGRKLAFCLLLSKELAERGFHVLSMDMRGFGESEDPHLIDEVDSWQSKGDVSKAIDFLIKNATVDTSALFIVGHSAGANQAIIAGIYDHRLKKIVAIGPSRRVKERILSDQAKNREYFIERFARDRKLTALPSWETYRQISINAMLDTYIPYFQTEDHKPLFLIDGSLEGPEDLEFLRNIYQELIPPKKYFTIEGSNHYSNTKALGPLIFYHKQVFDELVDKIASWLKESLPDIG